MSIYSFQISIRLINIYLFIYRYYVKLQILRIMYYDEMLLIFN